MTPAADGLPGCYAPQHPFSTPQRWTLTTGMYPTAGAKAGERCDLSCGACTTSGHRRGRCDSFRSPARKCPEGLTSLTGTRSPASTTGGSGLAADGGGGFYGIVTSAAERWVRLLTVRNRRSTPSV